MPHPDHSVLSTSKENLPRHLGVVMAVMMAAFSLASSYASKNTQVEDVQKDQERRLELLEKDTANRRELDDVKKTGSVAESVGKRVVEKTRSGKVQRRDFPTTLGNPAPAAGLPLSHRPDNGGLTF